MAFQRTIVITFFLFGMASSLLTTTAFPDGRKTFRIPMFMGAVELDPMKLVDTNSLWITNQIYDTLFELSPSGEIKPRLVSQWSISPEGRALTLSLRKGLFFSDGSPLAASDVLFTLDRLRRFSKREGPLLRLIRKMTISPSGDVIIEFSEPVPSFPKILAHPSYSILPARYKSAIAQGNFFQSPIGSGPYRVEQWSPKNFIHLKTQPHDGNYKPSVEDIFFQFLDPAKSWTKEDILQFDLLIGLPAYNTSAPAGFVSHWYHRPAIEFLGFNLRHPFWKNEDMRKAFRKMFKKGKYYDEMFREAKRSWKLTDTPIPLGMLGSTKEKVAEPMPSRSDVDQVSKYLAKNGCEIFFASHDHLSEKRLSQVFVSAMPMCQKKIRIKKVSVSQLPKKIDEGKVGLFVLRLAADSFDPYEILIYFSEDAPDNYTGFEDRRYTEALRRARRILDEEKQANLYEELAEQLDRRHLIIPIASLFNERLFIREECPWKEMSPLGPSFTKMDQVVCQ